MTTLGLTLSFLEKKQLERLVTVLSTGSVNTEILGDIPNNVSDGSASFIYLSRSGTGYVIPSPSEIPELIGKNFTIYTDMANTPLTTTGAGFDFREGNSITNGLTFGGLGEGLVEFTLTLGGDGTGAYKVTNSIAYDQSPAASQAFTLIYNPMLVFGSSPTGTITLPTGDYTNVTVLWGDGQSEVYNGAAVTPSHTYANLSLTSVEVQLRTATIHTVGTGPGNLVFGGSQIDRNKLLQIRQWSDEFQIGAGAFEDCANLDIATQDLTTIVPVFLPDVTSAFKGCDLGGSLAFGTSTVWATATATITNMTNMFQNTSLNQDLTSFDFSNCTTTESMFEGCTSLNSVLGGGTSFGNSLQSVLNLKAMFKSCTALTEATALVSTFKTDFAVNMESMFEGCTALNFNLGPNVSAWLTDDVTSMKSMFKNCTSFNGIFYAHSDTSGITTMESMFEGATVFNQSLTTLDFTALTSSKAMFKNAVAFNNVLPTTWPVILDASEMFSGASAFNDASIVSLTLGAGPITMESMFKDAITFTASLNWGAGTGSVTNMKSMFEGASSLQTLNNSFATNTGNVTDMSFMFKGCDVFNHAEASSLVVTNCVTLESMFEGATVFNRSVGTWSVNNCLNMKKMFEGSAYNATLAPTFELETGNVTDMSFMFKDSSMNHATLANIDVFGATNMESMMENVPFNINLAAWEIDNVTNMTNFMLGVTTFATATYDATWVGWGGLILQPNVSFHGGSSTVTPAGAGETARAGIVSTYTWTVTDGDGTLP